MSARDLAATVRALRAVADLVKESGWPMLTQDPVLLRDAADAIETSEQQYAGALEAIRTVRSMYDAAHARTEIAEARAVRAEEALRQVERFAGDPDVGVDDEAYEVIAGIVRDALAAAGADTP